MPRTLFIDSTLDIDRVWKRVHGPGDVPIAVNMGPVAEGDIPGTVQSYDTVINDATYFTEATLKLCRGLKHIVFLGTGAASFVDLAAAQRLGIKVSTIGGYGDTTVAEHAMGLVFAAARHIATMHGIVRAGGWRPMQGMELRGKTLGVIGLGGIGREMARIAGGVGLRVIAFNRSAVADSPVPMVALDELLAHSDIVSLHLALNEATQRFPRPREARKDEARNHRRQHRPRRCRRRGGTDRPAARRPCRPLRDRRVRPGTAVARRTAAEARQRHAHCARRLQHA